MVWFRIWNQNVVRSSIWKLINFNSFPLLFHKEADLDLDGYTLSKPTAEQWRWFQLSKLLDQLSSSIPTQAPPLAPIYRTGRTYPSVGYTGYSSQANDYASSRSMPTLRLAMPTTGIGYNPSQNFVPREIQKARKQSVLGIDWGGSRPTGSSALVTVRRSQALANGQGGLMDRSQQHHSLGTGEVAIHTPMHSRSAADYEWKRVENLSKWNNLRGMWGKRASSSAFDSVEEPTSAAGASAANPNVPYQFAEDQLVWWLWNLFIFIYVYLKHNNNHHHHGQQMEFSKILSIFKALR